MNNGGTNSRSMFSLLAKKLSSEKGDPPGGKSPVSVPPSPTKRYSMGFSSPNPSTSAISGAADSSSTTKSTARSSVSYSRSEYSIPALPIPRSPSVTDIRSTPTSPTSIPSNTNASTDTSRNQDSSTVEKREHTPSISQQNQATSDHEDVSKLISRIEELTKERDFYEKQMMRRIEERENLQTEVASVTEERDFLIKKIEALVKERETFLEQIFGADTNQNNPAERPEAESQEVRILRFIEERQAIEKRVAEISLQKQELEVTVNTLQDQKQATSKDLAYLREQLTECSAKKTDLEQTLQRALEDKQEQIAKLQELVDENVILHHRDENHQRQMDAVQKENQELKTQIEVIEDKCHELYEERLFFHQQLQGVFDKSTKQSDAELGQRLLEENLRLQQEKQALVEQMNGSLKEQCAMMDEVAKKKQEFDDLINFSQYLKDEQAKLNKRCQDQELQITTLTASEDNLQTELTKIRDENEHFKSELRKQLAQVVQLEEANARLESMMQQFQGRLTPKSIVERLSRASKRNDLVRTKFPLTRDPPASTTSDALDLDDWAYHEMYSCRSLASKRELLSHALQCDSADTLVTVILYLQQTLSHQLFLTEVCKHPTAVEHFISYLNRVQNDKLLIQLYRYLNMPVDEGMCRLRKALRIQDPYTRLQELQICSLFFDQNPDLSFQAEFVRQEARALELYLQGKLQTSRDPYPVKVLNSTGQIPLVIEFDKF